ncbi:hypothetical protein ACRALDRAFT_2020300 [Sodiomyces alcalophilus JCM 7366]|uniref:uncharacterized protein n=1 Tax=Sodiomyces alcalophilus JCM 7366 TaxID=591952 RepID=UPI0039B384B1
MPLNPLAIIVNLLLRTFEDPQPDLDSADLDSAAHGSSNVATLLCMSRAPIQSIKSSTTASPPTASSARHTRRPYSSKKSKAVSPEQLSNEFKDLRQPKPAPPFFFPGQNPR